MPQLFKTKFYKKGMNIELGAGDYLEENFIHVDIRMLPHIEIVADCGYILPFKDKSIDTLLASHLIEHFSWRRTKVILQEWTRVIKKGGILLLRCPNLKWILRRYLLSRISSSEFYKIQAAVYGNQDYLYNYHYAGFDWGYIKDILKSLNYTKILDLSSYFCLHNYKRELFIYAIK